MAEFEERLSESEIKQILNFGDIEYSSMEGKIIGLDDDFTLEYPEVLIYVDSINYEVGQGYLKLGVTEKHDITGFIYESGFTDAGKMMSQEEFIDVARKSGYTITQEDFDNLKKSYGYENDGPHNALTLADYFDMFNDESLLTISRLEILFELTDEGIIKEDNESIKFALFINDMKFVSEEVDESSLSIKLSDFVDISKFNQIAVKTAVYAGDMDNVYERFSVFGTINL